MHKFKFIGGTDPVLDKRAFIEMNYATVMRHVTWSGKRNANDKVEYDRLKAVQAMWDSSVTNSLH